MVRVVIAEGAIAAAGIPAAALNLDHFCAVVGQMHCAIGARQHAAEVQHAQTFEDLRAHGAPFNVSRNARIGVFTASGFSAKAMWRRPFKMTALAP